MAILQENAMTTPTAGFGLVLDCADPRILADFWSAALVAVDLAGHQWALAPNASVLATTV